MATQVHKLKGKLKWSMNLTQPDEFRGSTNYKVNLYDVDEDAWKATGVQTRPKEDKDGDVLYLLKRPQSRVINKELVEFGPIAVVDTEGNDISDKLIGNGSEAVVEFITYDTSMGKGHRVNRVIVTDLIEYEPPVDTEMPAVSGTGDDIDASVFE